MRQLLHVHLSASEWYRVPPSSVAIIPHLYLYYTLYASLYRNNSERSTLKTRITYSLWLDKTCLMVKSPAEIRSRDHTHNYIKERSLLTSYKRKHNQSPMQWSCIWWGNWGCMTYWLFKCALQIWLFQLAKSKVVAPLFLHT